MSGEGYEGTPGRNKNYNLLRKLREITRLRVETLNVFGETIQIFLDFLVDLYIFGLFV